MTHIARDFVANSLGGMFQGTLRTLLSLDVYPIVSFFGQDKWLQGAAEEVSYANKAGLAARGGLGTRGAAPASDALPS